MAVRKTRNGGRIAVCDDCFSTNIEEDGENAYGKVVGRMKVDGWVSFRTEDGMHDVCPECRRKRGWL